MTAAELEVYNWHKDVCQSNGIGQTSFYHRQPEGALSAVSGFPNNTDYSSPAPRSVDNPKDAAVLVWMCWTPKRVVGSSPDAGDSQAGRAWIYHAIGQMPAFDDSGNQISMQDDDFGVDPQGLRFHVENPVLSPDGSYWTFEIVRHR